MPDKARQLTRIDPMKSLRFDVFGHQILVTKSRKGWAAYYLGAEGKRRPATDKFVPSDISESEVQQYLGDLCHEWATERHPGVKRLDWSGTGSGDFG